MRPNSGASQAALEEVYRRRYAGFLRLGFAILGSHDLAREAVQETFAAALRERESFRGEGSLEGWLWKAMLNTCRQEQRRRRRLSDEQPPELGTNGQPAEWPELRALIAALPDQERHALFLRYYADLSQDEIADVLGVRPGTVGATLTHARNKLRVALRPEVAR
ncbi:MAG TPA: sigma-70 family RNA polymerase sigma factor [Gaiellaceae bacterium]|nr:sigma-70 family RNA polymerase sigma factor [Gaiellaceae bacterium]